VRLLAPAAPFAAEGLWQWTGGFGRGASEPWRAGKPNQPFGPTGSIHEQPWPDYDEALTHDDVATIVVQVNGKVRERLQMPANASQDEVTAAALARPRIQDFVANPAAAKYVYVSGRLLNIVTSR
jgi:leucyl-tRNA synthetase